MGVNTYNSGRLKMSGENLHFSGNGLDTRLKATGCPVGNKRVLEHCDISLSLLVDSATNGNPFKGRLRWDSFNDINNPPGKTRRQVIEF